MSRVSKSGKYLLQIGLSKDDYEIFRKEAYKLDMTINKAIVLFAKRYLKSLRK